MNQNRAMFLVLLALIIGCTKETVREAAVYPEGRQGNLGRGIALGEAYSDDGGYNTILPYGGYAVVGRDGQILGGGADSCCGGGINITQTQGSEGDADQSQTVTIDQSDNSEDNSEGLGGGTEQTLIEEMTPGPIPIEAITNDGQWWMGEAGTHVVGMETPIQLVNPHGDVLVGSMNRRLNSGLPLSLTHIPADGGEPSDVVFYKDGFHSNYSVE